MMSRASLQPWLRRPAAIAGFSVVALAALLSGGLVVAHAVDGAPTAGTAAASPSPSDAGSSGSGTNNVAAAVNSVDGKTVYAIKLRIVQTASDTVDAGNAAAAVNDGCTDCSTVAIAFEGVLVAGSPSTFDPTNLALAYNVACSGCTAFADAYQQVVQSSTRVRITGAGRRQVAAIRQDLDALRHESLSLDQVVSRVKVDEQAFADVLLHDCVPVGHDTTPAAGTDISDNPDAGSSAAPSAAPSASTDASTAAPSAQASPSDAPSDAPSASDVASPSSTP
jgi:putative peptide zinc metalloprotease protein